MYFHTSLGCRLPHVYPCPNPIHWSVHPGPVLCNRWYLQPASKQHFFWCFFSRSPQNKLNFISSRLPPPGTQEGQTFTDGEELPWGSGRAWEAWQARRWAEVEVRSSRYKLELSRRGVPGSRPHEPPRLWGFFWRADRGGEGNLPHPPLRLW